MVSFARTERFQKRVQSSRFRPNEMRNGTLLRFWPSLWLEMVSSTFTWPGTIILNVCVHVLMYFVILPWWRTTPEEVGTAWRNYWRRSFGYSWGSWSIRRDISRSWSVPSCLWHVWLYYYPSQSDSRIHSSSQTSASDSSRWLEETSCWSFKWANSERRTVRLLVLGMWLLFYFIFWFRYHFSL